MVGKEAGRENQDRNSSNTQHILTRERTLLTGTSRNPISMTFLKFALSCKRHLLPNCGRMRRGQCQLQETNRVPVTALLLTSYMFSGLC